MIKSKRRYFALVAGLLATAGFAFAAPAANAVTLPLPVCSSVAPSPAPVLADATNQPGLPPHCWYLPEGTVSAPGAAAGVLAANDGHTRYRFIQTNFKVSDQFIDLNGTGLNGAVGIEECDPNIAYAAQFGIAPDPNNAGAETPFVAQGFWNGTTGDPCINHTPLVPAPSSAPGVCPPTPGGHGSILGTSPNVYCKSFAAVGIGDQLTDFAIYYTPGGGHVHQVSFGFCDVTQGNCRQAYAPGAVNLNFWELGIGVFSGQQGIGAPPSIPVVAFTQTSMNCYACKAAFRPISVIQPVNSSGVGGIENVQDVNGSGQAVIGPNNSLDLSGNLTIFNGSTS
jgi:hypothetical protein